MKARSKDHDFCGRVLVWKLALFMILALFSPALMAETLTAKSSGAERTLAAMRQVDEDILFLNNMVINKKTKEIRIKAQFALEEGILEYLLVGEHGKDHETVFTVSGNLPSELNFGLILIGCEAMKFDDFIALSQDPEGEKKLLTEHHGSLLSVEFFQNGKPLPASYFIKDREGKEPVFNWVYTGGFFLKGGRYTADLELSWIGIYPDLTAVVNLFSGRGNPYRGQFGYEINNRNKKLAKGQEYEIVIRRKP